MHPNLKLLSNSGDEVLHGCPRRWYLDRMLVEDRDGDFHTWFGHAVGLGIQELLTHGNRDRAYWEMFRTWEGPELDALEAKAIRDKKTFYLALEAVDRFVLPQRTVFGNMRLATLNGRPATEIGFTIDCGDGFLYRGFIDAILIDDMRSELVVVESKTTKFSKVDEAMFKHSGQALGYSLIVDMIIKAEGLKLGSAYKVYYPVYKTGAMEWEVLPFTKTHVRRAMWIRSLLLDIKHIVEYDYEDFFPMYGNNCYNFFRQCPHFGRCEFEDRILFNLNLVPIKVDDPKRIDFRFSLVDMIEQQIEKGA